MGAAMAVSGLRICQVVPSLENAAAGTTACVTRLSQSLAALGTPVELVSTGIAEERREGLLRMRTFAVDLARVPVVGQLYLSRALLGHLAQEAAGGSVLHSNGLWLMPNVYPAWVARRHRVPLVTSPHGMLAPAALRYSASKKRLFAALLQRRALAAADCLHATSKQEFEEIRAYGLNAPVAIVPNGIDVPPPALQASPPGGMRTMLYLGRIHPIKGLHQLLSAWAMVTGAHPDWRLRVVGPSQGGHGAALAAQASQLGLRNVSFEEGIFGAAKDAAYRDADVFVLPSLNENFAMVVAEALANGTPVIATKGTPWQGLETHGCGWWTDHGAAPIAAALGAAMAMPRAELRLMGARGREWMLRDFSWDRIAREMQGVYLWCKDGGEPPACVIR